MSPFKLFANREEAGRQLGRYLQRYRADRPIVVGLTRGGVPVAYEVARALDAPLDVCVVRKICAPFQPELGVGAVTEGGALYLRHDTIEALGIDEDDLLPLIAQKRAEVEDRVRRFRRGSPPADVTDKTVIIVDDGIATGGTACAAVQSLRDRGASKVVLAVPVGAAENVAVLAEVADEMVCPYPEDHFYAVGLWYDDFGQTSDDDVVELLERMKTERSRAKTSPAGDGWAHRRSA
ncbi:MAG: phosphoribosyltransferase [Polyangiaceae bacterium]|nr:phosphoribosyltransferase [Polyangiaceae bacterium]